MGLGSGPSVRKLVAEHGSRWRSYKGGPKVWSWHRYIYDEIEARLAAGEAEEGVISALQERLAVLTKTPPPEGQRGKKPAAANWQGLAAELAIARPRPRACTSSDAM